MCLWKAPLKRSQSATAKRMPFQVAHGGQSVYNAAHGFTWKSLWGREDDPFAIESVVVPAASVLGSISVETDVRSSFLTLTFPQRESFETRSGVVCVGFALSPAAGQCGIA
jgi:hypothetical protein